ncbi:helix-turn-helix domain-containing protein [Streptomyces venezuelae]|uniref:DNA-binding protein n=1 Tax=Streptomyces sp. B6(2022) TaxID=3404749 RepID=UPI00311D8FDA
MPADSDRSQRFLKYETPVEPASLDADLMTVQETAYVLKCSVPTVRRRLKELGLTRKPGRRVVVTKADRAALIESSLVKPPTGRRGRGRKPLAPIAA